MPTLDSEITDFVVGDNIEIRRTITNVPASDSLVKAWLTIKRLATQDDADAILQKAVTTVNQTTEGQITDDGSGDQEAEVVFRLSGDETVLMRGDKTYYFDIQVKTSTGAIYTPELGTITGRSQITKADT